MFFRVVTKQACDGQTKGQTHFHSYRPTELACVARSLTHFNDSKNERVFSMTPSNFRAFNCTLKYCCYVINDYQ